MKVDTFRIDGGEYGWVGLHNPDFRWNGWACPSFTYETMQAIGAWIDSCVGDDPDAGRLIVKDGRVWESHEGEVWEILPTVIDGVDYFATDGWVWDADSDFPADDEEAQ